MPRRDIVVMGASAGGIEALTHVLAGVPETFAGSILVVLHLPEGPSSALPAILDRAGPLTASAAVDGEPIRSGHVHVCRAGRHLLVGDGVVLLRRGPRENGHRPAVDPLFRSAAWYFGARAIGVVLSGSLSDGTAGLQAIRSEGGTAIVQDPATAIYPSMPSSALEEVGADHILDAPSIGPLLTQLAEVDIGPSGPPTSSILRQEVAIMEAGERVVEQDHPGRPSPWPCPDCSGVLWEINDGDVLRFRCRVGHAWSSSSLMHAQSTEVETALWVALRSLEDRAALNERQAQRATDNGRPMSAERYRADLVEVRRSIETLRGLLEGGQEDELPGEAARG